MAISRFYASEQTELVASENSGVYSNFFSLSGANAFFNFGQKPS
ncbi:hypothetical protein [Desulfosporosinus sp. FKB]|nr:hypothetical protein [Desulfosporosinus sp. FKB]